MKAPDLTFGDSLTAVDALFFSPHPDDVELFAGGLLATLAARGHAVGIADLTRGELGSLGTPEVRAGEAAAASKTLLARWRAQLSGPDGGLSGDESALQTVIHAIVGIIRNTKPSLIVCPYWQDRHPDHEGASLLVTKAAFFANLKNFLPGAGGPHEVLRVLYYPTRVNAEPSFVVDVSAAYSVKKRAIACYASQVGTQQGTPGAPPGTVPLVSSRLSLSSLEARDASTGALIGTAYGEGYIIRSAVPLADPVSHFRAHQQESPLFYLR